MLTNTQALLLGAALSLVARYVLVWIVKAVQRALACRVARRLYVLPLRRKRYEPPRITERSAPKRFVGETDHAYLRRLGTYRGGPS